MEIAKNRCIAIYTLLFSIADKHNECSEPLNITEIFQVWKYRFSSFHELCFKYRYNITKNITFHWILKYVWQGFWCYLLKEKSFFFQCHEYLFYKIKRWLLTFRYLYRKSDETYFFQSNKNFIAVFGTEGSSMQLSSKFPFSLVSTSFVFIAVLVEETSDNW